MSEMFAARAEEVAARYREENDLPEPAARDEIKGTYLIVKNTLHVMHDPVTGIPAAINDFRRGLD